MGDYYGECRVTGVHCTQYGCWWSSCVRHEAGEADMSDPPKKEAFGGYGGHLLFIVVATALLLFAAWLSPRPSGRIVVPVELAEAQ